MRILLLAAISSAFAFAQLQMPLQKGVAVATCFSGWKTQNPFTIDLDAPVIGLVDVRDKTAGTNPGVGNNWKPDMFHNETSTLPANQWTARRMGQVFGLAIDKNGNIFVAASRIYGAQGSVGETGVGLWGSAGPGGVYKIDSAGNVTDFIATLNSPTYSNSPANVNKIPNTGPGLGNLAYDMANDQLLVTNFEDGRIYRLVDLHLPAGRITGVPYSPIGADDGVAGFADAGLLATNGTQIGRRIWGIGVFAGRAYFSVWAEHNDRASRNLSNSVHSVAITGGGVLNGGTIRKEFDAQNYLTNLWSNPISDIEFSSGGKMLVAERTMSLSTMPDYLKDLVFPPLANGGFAHRARVVEYHLSGILNNVYTPGINPLWTGEVSGNANSTGGIDYGYIEYDPESKQLGGCEQMLWATGDYLRTVGGGVIYGLQGTILGVNTPATNDDFFVDLNGNLSTQDKTKIGDVDIYRDACGAEGQTGVVSHYLSCVNEGAGQYNFVLTVANNETSDAYGAVVLLPNGTTTNLTFAPPLAPGATTTVTIPITIGYQSSGNIINFVFQFHGKPLPPPLSYEWCDKPITIPVKVPECGCLTATLVRSGLTGNSLGLLIKNLAISPNSTFLTLDVKTPGLTIAPGSLNLSIPLGNTVFVPITLTPTPAIGTFVRVAITLHGKNLGNGLFENCCMEEADFPIPRQIILNNGTGIYGNVFVDENSSLRLDLREARLANIPVTYRPTNRERRPVTVRTNESGEYFIPISSGEFDGTYQLDAELPREFQYRVPRTAIRTLPALSQARIVIENLPVARLASETAPGVPVLPFSLEPTDGIGGGATSAIRYTVPTGMATLRLLNEEGAEAGVIHNGFHAGGDYVAIVRSHDWQSGFYTLELVAAGETQQQPVYVAPIEESTPLTAAKQAGVRTFRVQVRQDR